MLVHGGELHGEGSTTADGAVETGQEPERGNDPRAAAAFAQASRIAATKAQPHINRARAAIVKNQHEVALQEAELAVEHAPNSSRAWNTKGRAEFSRNDYRAAMESFYKAVELDRGNVWALNNLGYTELLLAKYTDAYYHLGQATESKAATAYMFNNFGLACEHLDRRDEARDAFEQAARRGSAKAIKSLERFKNVKPRRAFIGDPDPTPHAVTSLGAAGTAIREGQGHDHGDSHDLGDSHDHGDGHDHHHDGGSMHDDLTASEQGYDRYCNVEPVNGDLAQKTAEMAQLCYRERTKNSGNLFSILWNATFRKMDSR